MNQDPKGRGPHAATSPARGELRLPKRVTVPAIRAMKLRGERIAMLTAYDATFARMLDEGGADMLLVGDSLGMVVQGLDSTLPVTVDEMIYHCRAVARGTRRAMVVGDLPFLSFQLSTEQALRNAGRFLAEGGAQAVKLEGGAEVAPAIRSLVSVGIPVVGHVGLRPQSVHAMGGFRVQGKTAQAANEVLDDARAVAEAGAFAIVLEGIPSDLAERITNDIDVPTIGIGAGAACDGQVLVCYDMLGLTPELRPKFVKRFAEFYAEGRAAAERYCEEVKAGLFPTEAHGFGTVQREDEAPPVELPAQSYGPTH
ncbi:MAG TPA: 3-methyl-2-oxobutanoate hydroxymethyltransferase [Polyangiales bacterium]